MSYSQRRTRKTCTMKGNVVRWSDVCLQELCGNGRLRPAYGIVLPIFDWLLNGVLLVYWLLDIPLHYKLDIRVFGSKGVELVLFLFCFIVSYLLKMLPSGALGKTTITLKVSFFLWAKMIRSIRTCCRLFHIYE